MLSRRHGSDVAVAVIALAGVLVGCHAPPAWPEAVVFLEARSGEVVRFERVVDDLMRARVIYVGERHDREVDHRVQRAVLEAIHQRSGSLALGLEMFQWPFQDALDDYVAGRIDESTMLGRTEYESRWGFDFRLYRPLLQYARTGKIPVVALNARREVTRTVARGGLEALSDEQRARLPEMELESPRHRQIVLDALEEHPGLDERSIEQFYAAQVIWDETMASRVAQTLEGPDAPRRMVVLAGTMHVREGVGIPDRAARRGAEPYRVLIPEPEHPWSKRLPPADYLWRERR